MNEDITQKINVDIEKDANKDNNGVRKSGLLESLGNVSDERISFLASCAVFIMLVTPAIVAVLDMFLVSISFTTILYQDFVAYTIFPLVSIIAFVLYFLNICRLKKEKKNILLLLKQNIVLVLFSGAVLWMFLSQFINGIDYAMGGFHDNTIFETFDMQFGYFIFVLFCATQVRIEKHKRFLLRSQMLISVLLGIAAFYLWHRHIFAFLFDHWDIRFSAIFSNANYYGYYLSFCTPLAAAAFVYEKKICWKFIAGLTLVLNSVALAINNTFGAWIGAAIAILFCFIAHCIIEKKFNWEAFGVFILFILVICISGHCAGTLEKNIVSFNSDIATVVKNDTSADNAGNGRWIQWKDAAQAISENILFGIGFEGILHDENLLYTFQTIRPHNEFLQYALFYGIPMVLLYFLGCLGIYIRGLKKRKDIDGATIVCLVTAMGYLVSSLFGLTVFNTAMYLFVYLGMGYTCSAKTKDESTQITNPPILEIKDNLKDGRKYKDTLFEKIYSITNDEISLYASISMSILLIVPIFVSIYAMINKHIEYYNGKYIVLMHKYEFPVVSFAIIALFCIKLLQFNKNKVSFKSILKRHPLIIVFSGAVIWKLISQLYNGFEYAFGGYMNPKIGETFDLELGYFIFILFGSTLISKKEHKQNLIRINACVSFLIFVAGFFVWDATVIKEYDTFYYTIYQKFGFNSMFFNANYYGYYLSVTIPLIGSAFIYEKKLFWKVIMGLSFIVNTVALSLNDTLGSWIGTVFALIFIIVTIRIIKKKISIISIVLLLVFCFCIYITGHINGNFEKTISIFENDIDSITTGGDTADYAGSGRWILWKESMKIIGDNKLLGIGFEGVDYKEYTGPHNVRPHNEFMQYALFYGIPMMLIYIAGCLGVFIRAFKHRRSIDAITVACLSGAFGYLVGSFFGLTVYSTTFYLFMFLGMGYAQNSCDKTFENTVEDVVQVKKMYNNLTINYYEAFRCKKQ